MLNLINIHKFHKLEHTSLTLMTIQTVSISKKASKVKGDSQAAWLRFQEVQVLHQLQADRAYQECPAGWREGGVGQLSGSSLEWKWNTSFAKCIGNDQNASELSVQRCLRNIVSLYKALVDY